MNIEQFNRMIQEGVVVVDFYATWCGPCKMLAPIFEELGEELKEVAKFEKVDVDQSMEIARFYNVSSVPTMIIFKEGEVMEMMAGFLPKELIKQKVQQYL